jgi:hypothetical protein
MALSRSPRASVSSALRETAVHDTRLVLAVLATEFLGRPMVTGFDRLRWHPLPPPNVVHEVDAGSSETSDLNAYASRPIPNLRA